MAETFSAAAGALSFAALFNNCVDCFEYIWLSRRFEGLDLERRQLQLDIVKNRLTRWREAVRINDDSFSLSSHNLGFMPDDTSSRHNPARETLLHITLIFQRAQESSKRYEIDAKQDNVVYLRDEDTDSVFGELRYQLRDAARRRQRQTDLLKKAKWVIYSTRDFDNLVGGIIECLDNLERQVLIGTASRKLADLEIQEVNDETSLMALQEAAAGIDSVLSEAAAEKIEVIMERKREKDIKGKDLKGARLRSGDLFWSAEMRPAGMVDDSSSTRETEEKKQKKGDKSDQLPYTNFVTQHQGGLNLDPGSSAGLGASGHQITDNPSESTNEWLPHIFPDMASVLKGNPDAWRGLLPHLPPAIKANLEYVSAYKRPVWIYRPREGCYPDILPLYIAGAPIVIPVQEISSLLLPSGCPKDPYPHRIDPSDPLTDDVILQIFHAFPEGHGFFLLLSGDLQVIVPEDFDYAAAMASNPPTFGELRVSYIPMGLLPTARAQAGGEVEAKKKGLFAKHRKMGRLGVFTERDSKRYCTVSTHLLKEASGSSVLVDISGVLSRKGSADWAEGISIFQDNLLIGNLTHSFDAFPDSYPLGYSHDVSLVELEGTVQVELEPNVQIEHEGNVEVELEFPGKLSWMLKKDWDDLRRCQTRLRVLEPHLSPVESIKSDKKSDAYAVGVGIMRRNSKEKCDHDTSLWEKQIARMVLYRTKDFNVEKAMGMSGAAIVAEKSREGNRVKEWAIAGFQSFVQSVHGTPRPFVTEKGPKEAQEIEDDLRKDLGIGRVAFFGAFSVPKELQEEHTIIS
ncbi:hypothetical protein ACJ41O_006700 [Fusarium nematophilum]